MWSLGKICLAPMMLYAFLHVLTTFKKWDCTKKSRFSAFPDTSDLSYYPGPAFPCSRTVLAVHPPRATSLALRHSFHPARFTRFCSLLGSRRHLSWRSLEWTRRSEGRFRFSGPRGCMVQGGAVVEMHLAQGHSLRYPAGCSTCKETDRDEPGSGQGKCFVHLRGAFPSLFPM